MFTSRKPRPSITGISSTVEEVRVCLVGAGVIANAHAEALASVRGVRIVSLVEPHGGRAAAFARKWNIPISYASLDAALAAGTSDAVHILTPPDSHFFLAEKCLKAGQHVLIEKPVAVNRDDGRALVALTHETAAIAAVNQNFMWHPAFARLQKAIADGEAGPLRSVQVAYNVPLRQLAAGQFGAWMFQLPKNILLEQAVHPLSQIVRLIGPIKDVRAVAGAPTKIAHDTYFYPTCDAILASATHTAQLQFAVGRAFPCWTLTAVCDDGVLIADMLNNRFVFQRRGHNAEPLDALIQSVRLGSSIVGTGIRNLADYVLALVKLKLRSDAFFSSMKGSIAAFYDAVRNGAVPASNLALGANLVDVCEQIGEQCFPAPLGVSQPAMAVPASAKPDIAILGGTGFIGRAVVAKLVAAGKNVRVMARNISTLPDVFHEPGVEVIRGDIGNTDDVKAAIKDAPVVVNLAHGGGGENFQAIQKALVGGAKLVAEACLATGAKLIHVGSIAGLYAGDPKSVITGATRPDPNGIKRADYARAKSEADTLVMRMHREQGLPLCILRPGVVVGEGTSPFHSGLGAFNNEQHCIGWNAGNNALPFVLVEDVASAIVAATEKPAAVGRSYNLVGDVRPTARAYIAALAKDLKRPLRFHPSSERWLFLEDLGKWLLKRVGGKKGPLPNLYDLKSRGLSATFDCTDAKTDLGWSPERDEATFFRRAFGHAK